MIILLMITVQVISTLYQTSKETSFNFHLSRFTCLTFQTSPSLLLYHQNDFLLLLSPGTSHVLFPLPVLYLLLLLNLLLSLLPLFYLRSINIFFLTQHLLLVPCL